MTSNGFGWDYGRNLPPELWHLHPDFAGGGCRRQSPIPIVDSEADDSGTLRELQLDYKPFPLSEFLFVAQHVEVEVPANGDGGGGILIGNHLHPLKQFHFHTPSEHTLDGRYYEMELQLVHVPSRRRVNYELLVVAVFYVADNEADEHGLLRDLISSFDLLRVERNRHEPHSVCSVDPAAGFPRDAEGNLSGAYYRYDGSLTTIPCTEHVRWIVLKTPVKAPPRQIEAFAKLVPGGNNRPLQPTNGRIIKKFG